VKFGLSVTNAYNCMAFGRNRQTDAGTLKLLKATIMKTRIVNSGLLAVLLIVSFACTQKKEEPAIDKEKIKAEIQAIENKFASIYNTRNIDSLTYYADDAISYFAGQAPISGKAAIHEFITQELKDFPEGAKLSYETIEIYVADSGNTVAEIGAYKQTDSTGTVMQSGHYVSFFKKRDGRYVCTRDMSNSSPTEK
jgi:ketosteroid isomerase-like protein